MRIMAIDYGDAHTGVAISDPTGLLAGTTTTIHSRKTTGTPTRVWPSPTPPACWRGPP